MGEDLRDGGDHGTAPATTAARAVIVARALRTGFAALADLALPGECAGCGTVERSGTAGRGDSGGLGGLCPGCAAVLDAEPFPVRLRRGRAVLPEVYALARYQAPLSDLIIAQKERGRLDLAGPLGRALARVVRAALADDPSASPAGPAGSDPAAARYWAERRILLVPVPSARAAGRRRGQDPVLRMARAAAARLRRDGARAGVLRALRHSRTVTDQVGLSVAARAANLAGALRATASAHRALADGGACTVVLLDDVCTSGATLGEAARAICLVPGFRASGGVLRAAVLAGPVR